MMFQPKLVLKIGRGGKYTLLVHTTVPDGCYYAGPITSGPPGGSGLPEVTYFTAAIERREGICTQAVREIVHVADGIELNDAKRGVSVTTTLKGQHVGNGYVGKGAMIYSAVNSIDSDGGTLLPDHVSATVIGSIFGRYKLIVSSAALVSTGGYTATLAVASPQGISPATLVMDMMVIPPSGKAIDIMSKVVAIYSDNDYKGNHSDVTVRLGSQHVTVPIIMIYGFGEAKVVGPDYDYKARL